jgi:hypothetical protein
MIKAKVIDILDNNVDHGMRFQIYEPSKDIIDPETKDKLGELKLPKIKVRVIKADSKFSVAETYIYKEVNKGGSNAAMHSISSMLAAPNYVKEYETFKIEERQKREIAKEKSFVRVGDIAEEIVEAED